MISSSFPDLGGIGIDDSGTSSGQQFLSSAGIDTQSLFRRARDLQSWSLTGNTTGTAAPGQSQNQSQQSALPLSTSTARTSSTPVELLPNLHESLQQTRATTIQNILLQQRNKTHNIVQEKIQSRLQDNFRRTVLSLGHVVPGSARRVNGLGAVSGRSSDQQQQQRDIGGGGAGGAMISAHAADIDWESSLIQSHLKLLDPSTSKSGGGGRQLQELSQLARDLHLPAYSNAINLFQTVSMSTSTTTGARLTARSRAIASLHFLADQFQNYILNQVKNQSRGEGSSSFSGSGSGSGGLLGYIHQFVEMEVGPTAVAQGRPGVMWRMVYYALRCGDLSCVRDIIASGAVVQVDDALVRYITEACRYRDGRNVSVGNKVDIGALADVPTNHVDAVGELYRRVESRNFNSTTSSAADDEGMKYEVAVLALLSFTPIENTSVSAQVQNTSEDYIFMGLWNAIRSGSGSVSGVASGAAGIVDEQGIDTVCALVENIKHYGPAHFEDGHGSNPNDGWVYAMLLLLCQQYKSGLMYLAGKSIEGLCVAVHLGLALREESIALADLSVKSPSDNTSASSSSSEDDLATLIVAFAKNLQTVSPSSAVNYLVRLPGDIQTGVELKNGSRLSKNGQDQICRLLIDTKAFAIIGGRMAPDGSRLASGALDKHIPNSGVSEILASAADQSMREGNIADTAELLSLAGRYSDLLSILNRQLSSLLVTENVKERNFWRDAAVNFHQTYLSQGQTHVLQVLESDRNLSLGNTFQLLLNLMAFFDRCNEGKWESAWGLIENLGLFPVNEREIPVKVESYSSLSSSIQQVFHHIVSSAMQSLYEQHTQLKTSLGVIHPGPNSGVAAIEQRLYEVRNRARVLVTFAGLIPMTCGVELRSKIGRMEAFMV